MRTLTGWHAPFTVALLHKACLSRPPPLSYTTPVSCCLRTQLRTCVTAQESRVCAHALFADVSYRAQAAWMQVNSPAWLLTAASPGAVVSNIALALTKVDYKYYRIACHCRAANAL